jgi:two-component system, OmpR family, response regulator MprA
VPESATILLVDDEDSIQKLLTYPLEHEGFQVVQARDGEEALARFDEHEVDLVILDVMLPKLDGLEVCRRLRADGNRVPVLMLTARDAIEDRIDGLDAGADDYLVKPFDVGELKARLRALLRRGGNEDAPVGVSFDELELDPARHGVIVRDQFVELTRTEFQLLELLMRNPRRVLTHNLIYERVWGYDFGPASNALRVYIGYLRRKLQDAGARPLLHTVRGVGYVLREP